MATQNMKVETEGQLALTRKCEDILDPFFRFMKDEQCRHVVDDLHCFACFYYMIYMLAHECIDFLLSIVSVVFSHDSVW